MRFSDAVGALLSTANHSIVDETDGGYLYIADVHHFVKTDQKIVSKIKDKSNSQQAKMIKDFLIYILNADDSRKFKRGAVRAQPKRKKK